MVLTETQAFKFLSEVNMNSSEISAALISSLVIHTLYINTHIYMHTHTHTYTHILKHIYKCIIRIKRDNICKIQIVLGIQYLVVIQQKIIDFFFSSFQIIFYSQMRIDRQIDRQIFSNGNIYFQLELELAQLKLVQKMAIFPNPYFLILNLVF